MIYSYDDDRTPEQNIAMALYAIASELNKIGLADAATPKGALELVAQEMRDGSQKIADAIGSISEGMNFK